MSTVTNSSKPCHASNFSVAVTTDRLHLVDVLRLVFNGSEVDEWETVIQENGPPRLVLYQAGSVKVEGRHPFPSPMEHGAAAVIVDGWLCGLKRFEYGPEPGIDGSVFFGVTIRTGRPDEPLLTVAVIEPTWLYAHK